MQAVRNYEKALLKQSQMSKNERNSELEREVQLAMDQVAALEAWDVANEAQKLLEILGVGITSRKVGELSGGQKKRVAMAATLLAKPEVVVLDVGPTAFKFRI